MTNDQDRVDARTKVGRLAGTAAMCIFAGAFLGAATNAMNAALCPVYFQLFFLGQAVGDIYAASIAQGILEGTVYGTLFAIVFTLTVGLVSRAECSLRRTWPYVWWSAIAVVGCWIIGGGLAVGLTVLSPGFARHSIGVPYEELTSMCAFAWVRGSICGSQLGAVLIVIVAACLFRANWSSQVNKEEATIGNSSSMRGG